MPARPIFALLTLTTSLLATAAATAQDQQVPDRIFVNGVIWTGDDAKPRAQALAIADDKLLAVGTDAEVRALAKPETAVVDLRGRFVTPGFEDSHVHIPGPSVDTIDMRDVKTLAEFQAMIVDFAKKHPDLPWIRGRNWGYSIFPNQLADKKYIDEVLKDRPVYLTERDGHMGLGNSLALQMAGITAATQDPPNGHIERHRNGEPTGELKEAAQRLIWDKVPEDTDDIKYQSLLAHLDEAAAEGITAVQDAMTDISNMPVFYRAASADALKVRVRLAPVIIPGVGPYSLNHKLDRPLTEADIAPYVSLKESLRGPLLKTGAIKVVLDGTVDAQTATMFEPYIGTKTTGIPFWDPDELNRTVALYDKAGFQLMIHAIGDRAVHEALDAVEYAARTNGTTGRRHRIEHAEVLTMADLARFKPLGVIASTQPAFANPDETVLKNFEPLLGKKRAKVADSFRIFDDAGIVQAFGSDWPNFPFSPIFGIHVAVTRTTPEGKPVGGWYPAGRISVDAALRHYTRDGAYASFDENIRGTLTPGKLADFVVLSQDLTKIPPANIAKTKVLLTVMGGRYTFRDKAF
jgi:predicted amidohydrolase YtcJ